MKLLRKLMHKQHELGYLTNETLRELSVEEKAPLYRLEELVSFYPAFRRTPPEKHTFDVCRDVCCSTSGCSSAKRQLMNSLNAQGIEYELREVSCLGRCDSAPAAAINGQPVAPLTLDDRKKILTQLTEEEDSQESPQVALQWKCDLYSSSNEFYETTRRLIASNDGLSSTCIKQLKSTNLTGRGGAGFPTGVKWELVANEQSNTKYVICNADESEPGTFKDREILKNAPHLVIEGMLLAGLTIGAESGIVYIRHEYGPEEKIFQNAIDKAYKRGVLGENAAGSGHTFNIEIFISPGGYILGEETALLEALEDKRGEPRNKPPYPGQSGLWGQPTLINNVETFAVAPSIIAKGPQWWSNQGINGFEGLKFVCISGDVESPGVFEVPMGTMFSEVIQMAGGIKEGKKLKAFLPGGASSLFMKPDLVETPIDFDAVKNAGSMLGTGAIMVFHEERNLYEIATNITQFFRNESCGKCVPCRIGSEKAVGILEGVSSGRLELPQLEVLDELHETLMETSICGLGQVALAPMLSMLKQFPEEITDHVG